MHQGLAAVLATGQMLSRPYQLVLLAEAAGYAGQVEEGLRWLAEALTAFKTSGRGDWLTEAYRLQGALLMHQDAPDVAQAEACFQQALTVARRQVECRAVGADFPRRTPTALDQSRGLAEVLATLSAGFWVAVGALSWETNWAGISAGQFAVGGWWLHPSEWTTT
jgi:predicted ATPase